MAEPFIGEIRMVGFSFAPVGWALCNGQLLPINQNQALFSLLGTMYGGNGIQTFALPNLQSRVAIHMGQGPGLTNRTQGDFGGIEGVSLTVPQMPVHTHPAMGNSGPADTRGPGGAVPAEELTGQTATYFSGTANSPMGTTAIGNTGGGAAHENMPPYLVMNFIIALVGIYPARN